MRRSAAPSQLQAAKRPRFMTPLLKPPGGNQSQIHVNSPAHKNGAQVGPKSKTFPSVGSQIGAKTLLSEFSTITTLPNPDYSAGASLSKPVYNARVRPSESVTGFSAGSSLPKPGSSTGATMSNSKLDCSSSSLMSKPAFNTNSSVSKPYFSDNGPLSTLDCNVSVSLPKPHFSGSASLPKSGCSTTSPEAQPGFTVSSSAPKPELSASSSVPHPDCSTIPSVPHSDCSTISSVPCSDCSTISLVPNPGCYDSPSFSKPDCSAGSSLPKAESSPSASLSKPDFSSSSPLSAGSSSTSSASLPIAKPDFSVGCNDFWENSQSQSDSSQKDPDLSQKPESQDNQTLQENINCTSLFRPGCHVENNGTDSNVNINGKEDISGTTDQVIKESRQTRARAARHKGFKAPTLRGPPSKLPNSTSTVIPASENGAQNAEPCEKYFNVMWCKASKKKHKKWEGDAVLVTRGRSVSLIDMDGKEIGKGGGYKISELQTLSEGQTLLIQGKEIEVMGILGEEDFKSGRCFQAAGVRPSPSSGTPAPSGGGKKPFVNPQGPGKKRKATGTKAGASNRAVGPRFDPEAPDALVMPRPTQAHQWEYNKNNLVVVDVVVDPHLALHLRPHQRDGVIFLYKCIMGMKPYLGRGAILADEMGLGKTLQCISLIWTLYKQGPYGGAPVLKRILIITPGSLVKNWSKEFKKWLGNERLSVFAVGPDHKAEEFIKCTIYPVMIISYEMFIRNMDVIKQVRFDLVVCDEGHRLKNTNIKTTSYVNSLNIQKRILLTGTPVQNDLQELYSLVELCNPGILGSLSAFRHVYEDPILASRQPNSDEAAKLLGESRAGELNRLTSLFILRRTQDINNKYLPPKVDMVLFCKPSSLQVRLYQQFIRSRTVLSYLSSSDSAKHLMCIAALKKLCNHPTLIYKQKAGTTGEDDFEDQYGLYQAVNPLFPEGYDPAVPETGESGKLQVLAGFLSSLSQTQERIVLVSNYTQTLNVLEHLCVTNNYQYLRLDGQTPTAKRQQLVERFNSKYSKDFVFLLSSKAGGVGLNLIGASRLVLYDIDWNPANDLQAMARVWRDGQKRRVHIYRLVTTGTLEEKIYQRQITKQGLSGTVVDAKINAKLSFSPEDLRDLFKLDEDTLCSTHDLLKCPCSQAPGQPPAAVTDGSLNRPCQLLADKTTNTQRNMCMSELLEWQHVPGPKPDLSHVDPLLTEHTDNITYVFWCESNTAAPQS